MDSDELETAAAVPQAQAQAASTATAASSSQIVTAVSLKLPPFWPNDPALWFAQIEAQFVTRGITAQDTKFSYVVSSLQPDIAQEVRDFIITPPAQERYDKLKSELIKRTSQSEQKRLHQLLIAEELGDRKPSQLLRRMRQLLGDSKLEDTILKQLWLQRLPSNVKAILASTSDSVTLDQLANLADKILEVTASSSIAQVSTPTLTSPTPLQSTSPNVSDDIQRLTAQVAKLTTQVKTLTSQLQQRGRSKDRDSKDGQRNFHRSRSNSRNRSECWYHRRFGAAAHKCVHPCTYSSSPSPTAQENPQAGN